MINYGLAHWYSYFVIRTGYVRIWSNCLVIGTAFFAASFHQHIWHTFVAFSVAIVWCGAVIVLVGNKADLDAQRAVSHAIAQSYADMCDRLLNANLEP